MSQDDQSMLQLWQSRPPHQGWPTRTFTTATQTERECSKTSSQRLSLRISQQDAQASTAVDEGTLIISQTLDKILIDPGSTHSYVSPIFAPKLNVLLASLDFTMTVITPIGDTLYINTVFKSSVVKIDERATSRSCPPSFAWFQRREIWEEEKWVWVGTRPSRL